MDPNKAHGHDEITISMIKMCASSIAKPLAILFRNCSLGSILGPLLSLVYINDLPEALITSARLFADDTSLFSVVHDSAASTAFLSDDLLKISRWAYQWKMIFNPDASKQAREIVFSRKANASNHETVYFKNVPVMRENI